MQIYLLLNTACNLSCSFCIRGKSTKCDLVQQKWKKILNSNNFSKFHLILTGGEPSLHSGLAEIIELSRSHFCSISVNTNGVKSDWIEQLHNRDIHVQISLDGTANVHNLLRANNQSNIFSRVLETIRKLENYSISYNISTTVGTQNLDNMPELMNFLSCLRGMQYWKVSPLLPFGCGDFDHCIPVNEWNRLVDMLVQDATVPLDIKRYFDFSLLDKYIEKNSRARHRLKTNCGDVRHKLYIYPDLTVYPCTCLTDFPLGNLYDQSLSEICTSPESKRFSEYNVNPQSYCSSCKYLPFCNGGCIGMSYHFFGRLGEGDYRCPLLQRNRITP